MLRSFRAALLASTMFVMPAKADPVFTPLALAAFQAGAGVAVTNAIIGIGALGSIFSAVGTLALAVGTSYLTSLLNRPQTQKPSDGQVETKQSIPPRVMHYGRVKVSGPLAYYESAGGTLIKVVLLSSRQIDAVETIYVDGRPVIVAAGGTIQDDPIGDVGYVRYKLGTADQTAEDMLVSGYLRATAAPGWTANHRLRGTAYLSCAFDTVSSDEFQTRYPNGEPQVAALIRGSLLYDPRDGVTRWSDNAALAVLDYLTHPDGYARPLAKIDLPSFIAMANICDEVIPLAAGGSETRYRVATSVALTESRKTVLARLLEACDGTLYPTQDGKFAIRGGKWEAPTVTIDADHGHILDTNFAPPDAMSRFNELSIQYLDPALDYVEADGTPWEDVSDITATGQIITVPADFVQIPSHSQARRLAKIRMARENCDWIGEVKTNLSGLNVIGERVITLNWPELNINGPYWVVGGPELLQDMTGVRLQLRSANSAAYDWTTAEEGTSTSVPPDTSSDFSLTPPVITLSQIAGPKIRATWTPDQALNRSYEVQYAPNGSSTYTAMTVASTRDSAESGVVAAGLYYVRIRESAGATAVGQWSALYGITIT